MTWFGIGGVIKNFWVGKTRWQNLAYRYLVPHDLSVFINYLFSAQQMNYPIFLSLSAQHMNYPIFFISSCLFADRTLERWVGMGKFFISVLTKRGCLSTRAFSLVRNSGFQLSCCSTLIRSSSFPCIQQSSPPHCPCIQSCFELYSQINYNPAYLVNLYN